MKFFIPFLFSIFTAQLVWAQGQTIHVRGSIRSGASGAPIIGATVLIKGTKEGASTDVDGQFTITTTQPLPLNIRISAIGYETSYASIAQESEALKLLLKEDAAQLEAVVVTASRKVEQLDEAPGAITVVGPKELKQQIAISSNIADVLAFSVPGQALSINQTGNSGQTLRGRNVLVLVDGIPQSTPLRDGGRDIRTIYPSAIERIEVIKGATAMYGNGADGGLINYITRRPGQGKRFGASTIVSATGNPLHLEHSVGTRLVQQLWGRSERYDYLVSGAYEQTGLLKDAEGDIISPYYGLGESDVYNFLGKAGYSLTKDVRLELMYNFFGSKQDSKYTIANGVYGEEKTRAVLGEDPGSPQGTPQNHNLALSYRHQHLIGRTSMDLNFYMQDFKTVYSFSDYFEDGGQSTILSNKKGVRLNLLSELPSIEHRPTSS